MTAEEVNKTAKRYNKAALYIIVALTLIGLLLVQVTFSYELILSLVFSSVYSLLTSVAYGNVWKHMAIGGTDKLTKFYLGGSVVKMLLALIVVVAGLFLLRSSKDLLLGFTAIFAAFFMVLLAFDCVFFARIAKSNSSTNK